MSNQKFINFALVGFKDIYKLYTRYIQSNIQIGSISTFYPWGISGLESISIFLTMSSFYVLNSFKYFLIYILEQSVSKSDKKDFELYPLFMC